MPKFIGCLIEEALESWRKWGIPEKDKKKIWDHIAAIHILKDRGLKGGAVDDARAPAVRDGTRGVVRWNGAS